MRFQPSNAAKFVFGQVSAFNSVEGAYKISELPADTPLTLTPCRLSDTV